jgi:uncharacterized protein DUF3788
MHTAGSRAPSRQRVVKALGAAREAWDAIHEALTARCGTLDPEWKPSKSEFGWMCALKQGKRTVVYLTPEAGAVRVAVVLGERAAKNALASGLPKGIKTLIEEARPYAEGRGIRFPVSSVAEVAVVTDLIAIKMEK